MGVIGDLVAQCGVHFLPRLIETRGSTRLGSISPLVNTARIPPWLCSLATVLGLTVGLLSLVYQAPRASDGVTIAVAESHGAAAHKHALDGFIQQLATRRSDVRFLFLDKANLEKDMTGADFESVDLIFTLGTTATMLAKDSIHDVPIVFANVLDPLGNGIIRSMASSGGNLTGVALDIPIETQFETMLSALPDMHTIGVLYDPRENNAIVATASRVAQDMGLILRACPVSSEKEIPGAIQDLQSEIDALWGIADRTVFSPNSRDFIILFTLRNKMPFMGFSAQFVKAGALLALYADSADIGRQSGDLAAQILNGTNPTELHIMLPRRVNLAVNLRVAERMGVTLPPQMVGKADMVLR